MSDVTDETTTFQKFPSRNDMKENLASGRGIPDASKKNHSFEIPDRTPGRDIHIRPRSPFREINIDPRNNVYTTSSSENSSVKVGDESEKTTTVRSVYEIAKNRHETNSPNLSVISRSTGNHHYHHGYPPSMAPPPPSMKGGVENIAGPYYHPLVANTGDNKNPGYYYPPPPPGYYYPPPPPGYYYPQYGGEDHRQNVNSSSSKRRDYYDHPSSRQVKEVDEIPDYENMSKEEQEEHKLIFKSKFAALKNNYPDRNYDDYDPNLPLEIIREVYLHHLKEISMETNSCVSRILLSILFLGIEAFCKKVLGYELRDYALTQAASMKRYDKLLTELGEKYTSGNGDWPVETRLIILAIVPAVVIIVVTFFMNKIGNYSKNDIDRCVSMINNSLNGQVESFLEPSAPAKIDSVTKTEEPPKPDFSSNLMGNISNLMNMGRSIGLTDKLGLGKSNDPAEIIASVGSKIINDKGSKTTKVSKASGVNWAKKKKK